MGEGLATAKEVGAEALQATLKEDSEEVGPRRSKYKSLRASPNAGGLEPRLKGAGLMGDSTRIASATERERACILQLAKLFEQGNSWHSFNAASFDLNGHQLTANEFTALMEMMAGLGAIEVQGRDFEGGWDVSIKHVAVQLAREIDDLKKRENEPRDIVEKVGDAARKNRFVGWFIIVSIVAASFFTIANQAVSLLQNLGFIAKP